MYVSSHSDPNFHSYCGAHSCTYSCALHISNCRTNHTANASSDSDPLVCPNCCAVHRSNSRSDSSAVRGPDYNSQWSSDSQSKYNAIRCTNSTAYQHPNR
jgi:hypothetical protein